jgi:hypothetical protein
MQHAEGLADLRRQPRARLRQLDLARAAQEQRLADMPSSVPARVKLPCRAAASKTRSAFSGNCFDSFMDKFSLCIQTVVRLEFQHFQRQTAIHIID